MGLTVQLVSKDLKEALRGRRVLASILMPAVIFPLIALGMSAAAGPKGGADMLNVAVVNMDNGTLGREVERSLAQLGAAPARGDPLGLLDRYSAVIYIPRNFTLSIVGGGETTVRLYVRYRGILAAGRYRDLEGLVRNVTVAVLSERMGAPPLDEALRIDVGLLLGDRVLGEGEVGALTAASAFGFFIVLIVSMALSASIAVAVGTEKEKRMLELLLATPVSFGRLILAKIVSSMLLALIELAALGMGLAVYIAVLFSTFVETPTLGVPQGVPSMVGALAHVVAVTVPLIFLTVAISLLMALRVEDLRTAQMTVPNTAFLLVFPAFLLYFVPPDALGPLAGVAYLYPYAHPFLVPLKVFGGDPNFTGLALALDSALAALAFVGLGRYMNAERIIVGVRRGRRRT